MGVYLTGDKHGEYADIKAFCKTQKTSKEKDVLIVLGDHGTRFYPDEDERTLNLLSQLDALPIRLLMVHGNHDRRVTTKNRHTVKKYLDSGDLAGFFYIDVRFPSILYAEEWGAYRIANHPAFIIGGAYSIDKKQRLAQQKSDKFPYPVWFKDEQLSAQEQAWALEDYQSFAAAYPKDAIILTHTCPLAVTPIVPAANSDISMETFFDRIAAFDNWAHWYCGHWHVDRPDGKYRFLYDDVILLEPNKEAAKCPIN